MPLLNACAMPRSGSLMKRAMRPRYRSMIEGVASVDAPSMTTYSSDG